MCSRCSTENSFKHSAHTGVLDGQQGVFVVGGYNDGETATLFLDLSLREWKTLPDLPAGGAVTLSNPGGLSGEHPLVMGGNLEDQVLEFDGSTWRALEVKLTSRDNGQSTTVSQEFASWLKTLDQVTIIEQNSQLVTNIQVDWAEEKICSSGGGGEDGKLRLSNIYADHMVFQVMMMILYMVVSGDNFIFQ